MLIAFPETPIRGFAFKGENTALFSPSKTNVR